ncbi:MAG: prolyl oligopeptidase family serine peptidase [Gemmatimonadales bacterium]|nr:prolyl oligopeptidase family serine peptidase [Gemmatimonadales bacterium]
MIRNRIALRALLASLGLVGPLAAQAPAAGYQQPPEPIRAILDATPTPAVVPSPDRTRLLLLERPGLPPISEVAAPYVPAAGLRLNPRTGFPTRVATFTGLRLLAVDGGAERPLALPAGARVTRPRFSPDGARLAFALVRDGGSVLALADAATGAVTVHERVVLNGALGEPCEWSGPVALTCRLVPADRGTEPVAPAAPAGPVVQESDGKKSAERTYQDLLRDSHDEARFAWHLTSQVARVSIDGRVTPLGAPDLVTQARPSPDGRWLLVSRIHRPFSYVVPLGRFPLRTDVWSADGAVVATIHDRPLELERSTAFDAVSPGPRGVDWRADAPATLAWVEALDGGNPATRAEQRDRVVTLAAPFSGRPTEHVRTATRVRDVTWIGATRAMVTEAWWKTQRTRSWLIDPSAPASAPRLLWDRSSEDAYGDPGDPVLVPNAAGEDVALTTPDGAAIYLTGTGASPEGDQPFVDRLDLATGRTTRLWRSQGAQYEEVVAVLDARGSRLLTRRETATEAPNYWVRDLVRRIAPRRLTSFTDPAPQFAGIRAELITYPRADGVQLSAKLYLPPGYDRARDGALPFLLWAYPEEFKSKEAAAQVRGSPHRFVRPGGASHLFLLTQGYGVLDGPTMPIVGEGDAEPNDSYVEQLTASAKAAVDELARRGVGDPARVAVGGHSYGAFMTANLLAHTSLFKAGIARSGAYNRTLTPFGFQQEERPYWQARDIYTKMSPFTYADSVKTPILLLHGMNDDNSGTFPIQSERFYAALKGNGATVRYVQLPGEAHGYLARESVGHTLWEMARWLDLYLKPKKVAMLGPR